MQPKRQHARPPFCPYNLSQHRPGVMHLHDLMRAPCWFFRSHDHGTRRWLPGSRWRLTWAPMRD